MKILTLIYERWTVYIQVIYAVISKSEYGTLCYNVSKELITKGW